MSLEATENTNPGSSSGPDTRTEPAVHSVVQVPVPPGEQKTCDNCRARRVRCPKTLYPCSLCLERGLQCTKDHVAKKRGPKKGHGRVIDRLKTEQARNRERSGESSGELEFETDDGQQSPATSNFPSPPGLHVSWASGSRSAARRPMTATTQPTPKSYLHLSKICVDLFCEHIYPTMPLLYMPDVKEMTNRPLSPSERTLLYSLSALTCFHMFGRNIQAAGTDSWEQAGRYFLAECIQIRKTYDFVHDLSLLTVICSFWLSAAFFEISDRQSSWYYLRESLTFAIEMGLDDETTYRNLSPREILCRQRVFWQLFVTERSYAILWEKPIVFDETRPTLPDRGHEYERPNIQSGFGKLISSYEHINRGFVTGWRNHESLDDVTYSGLQENLFIPPVLPSASHAGVPYNSPPPKQYALRGGTFTIFQHPFYMSDNSGWPPLDHTDMVQLADLLITQQWLRLVAWQTYYRNRSKWPDTLESSEAEPREYKRVSFPLAIALQTASILQALPPAAVEVHGMGIFGKVYEIGCQCCVTLGFSSFSDEHQDTSTEYMAGGVAPDGAEPNLGELVGVGPLEDFDVEASETRREVIDLLDLFVSTLSASPKSEVAYVQDLLELAHRRPGGMKMEVSPPFTIRPPMSSFGVGGGEVMGPPRGSFSHPMHGMSHPAVVPSSMAGVEMSGGLSEPLPPPLPPRRLNLPPQNLSPLSFSAAGFSGSTYGHVEDLPLYGELTSQATLPSPALGPDGVPMTDWSGSESGLPLFSPQLVSPGAASASAGQGYFGQHHGSSGSGSTSRRGSIGTGGGVHQGGITRRMSAGNLPRGGGVGRARMGSRGQDVGGRATRNLRWTHDHRDPLPALAPRPPGTGSSSRSASASRLGRGVTGHRVVSGPGLPVSAPGPSMSSIPGEPSGTPGDTDTGEPH